MSGWPVYVSLYARTPPLALVCGIAWALVLPQAHPLVLVLRHCTGASDATSVMWALVSLRAHTPPTHASIVASHGPSWPCLHHVYNHSLFVHMDSFVHAHSLHPHPANPERLGTPIYRNMASNRRTTGKYSNQTMLQIRRK